MARLKWERLTNPVRFSELLPNMEKSSPLSGPDWLLVTRTEAERDSDRILFSAPVRRLGDKTQVFPLERNDSVRNRLTHSHEVANLARSFGTYLVYDGPLKGENTKLTRDVPGILAAIGLAHDLGNPPFGHQGEISIRSWFVKHHQQLFDPKCAVDKFKSIVEQIGYVDNNTAWLEEQTKAIAFDLSKLTDQMKSDFLKFEGNAQTFRVVTRLQVVENDLGINLTVGTLAAMMKYTVPSNLVGQKTGIAFKKVGFMTSEEPIATEVFKQVGIEPGQRHPLAFVMEACDDIAYAAMDAEDAVKKHLVSFSDLVAWLENHVENNELVEWVVNAAKLDHARHRKANLSPSELNDVSMQKFRVYAIHGMMSAAIKAFNANYESIMDGQFMSDLIKESNAAILNGALKKFSLSYGYRHRGVLEEELRGHNVLHGLMDMLWRGISERRLFEPLDASERENFRLTPFASYAYQRISENYRRVFEGRVPTRRETDLLPVRYRELLLLTDMVSGMTDGFAGDLYQELKGFHVGASAG
jgi:dGTPase